MYVSYTPEERIGVGMTKITASSYKTEDIIYCGSFSGTSLLLF
jgi:hypothetical protein